MDPTTISLYCEHCEAYVVYDADERQDRAGVLTVVSGPAVDQHLRTQHYDVLLRERERARARTRERTLRAKRARESQ